MKKTIKTIAMLALVLGSTKAIAQNAAINSTGTAPDASAMLDVSSTTKGLLTPRMTAAQRGAISSPATGLMVYQTDGTDGFYYYDGSVWTALSGGGSSYPTVVNAESSFSVSCTGAYTTLATVTVPTTGKYLVTAFINMPVAAVTLKSRITQGGTVKAGTSAYASDLYGSISHVLNLSTTTDVLIEAAVDVPFGGVSPQTVTGTYSLVKLAD